MKMILIIIFSSFIFIGCMAQMVYPPMLKEGGTEQQRKKDALECKMLAADFKSKHATAIGGVAGPFPPGMAFQKRRLNEATEEANQFYVECMEERGYHKIEGEK